MTLKLGGETSMDKCSLCKGKLQEGKVNHIVDLDNFIIIIKNVPANVCNQCGEYYLDHEVAKEIERIVESFRENAAEIVIVNYFNLVA